MPLSPFRVTPWDRKVYVQIYFCYIPDLSGLEFLLSDNPEERRRFGGTNYVIFDQRLVRARLNPVLLEMQ